MILKFKIPEKILSKVKNEALEINSILFKKKVKNFNKSYFSNIKKQKNRSKFFEALNMMVSLNYLNYEIYKLIKVKIKKKLIVWTYPQIRLDTTFSKQYSSPLHVDQWILDKKKKGYIFWFPLNSDGSSLILSRDSRPSVYKKHKYWGIEAKDKIKLEEVKVPYGEGLLFDENLLHKSKENQNRLTVQLRYEEFNSDFVKKSVTQKIDVNVLNYWKNLLLN